MKNIGASMAGGGGKKKADNPHEYYPTPEGTTRALIPVLREIGWPDHIWEIACGEGHCSKQLEAGGFNVFSSDLVNRGYGRPGVNFLSQTKALAPSIITNPPFSLADEMLVHALVMLGIEHVAFLLPSGYVHAKSRVRLYAAHKPSLILPLTWRLDVTGAGAPTMNCSWYIWTSLLPPVRGFEPLVSTEKMPGSYDAAA